MAHGVCARLLRRASVKVDLLLLRGGSSESPLGMAMTLLADLLIVYEYGEHVLVGIIAYNSKK